MRERLEVLATLGDLLLRDTTLKSFLGVSEVAVVRGGIASIGSMVLVGEGAIGLVGVGVLGTGWTPRQVIGGLVTGLAFGEGRFSFIVLIVFSTSLIESLYASGFGSTSLVGTGVDGSGALDTGAGVIAGAIGSATLTSIGEAES